MVGRRSTAELALRAQPCHPRSRGYRRSAPSASLRSRVSTTEANSRREGFFNAAVSATDQMSNDAWKSSPGTRKRRMSSSHDPADAGTPTHSRRHTALAARSAGRVIATGFLPVVGSWDVRDEVAIAVACPVYRTGHIGLSRIPFTHTACSGP